MSTARPRPEVVYFSKFEVVYFSKFIDNADVVDGVLTVRATKVRKSRLVTLHPTATAALRAYATRCDRSALRLTPCPCFRPPRGEPLPYSTVRAVFRSLCCALGWNDRSPRPRTHDLRHSFACRRLQRWYAEDADVAPRVAALATYLGHAKVSDTYWYLTATPGLLALAAERFESFADRDRGAR